MRRINFPLMLPIPHSFAIFSCHAISVSALFVAHALCFRIAQIHRMRMPNDYANASRDTATVNLCSDMILLREHFITHFVRISHQSSAEECISRAYEGDRNAAGAHRTTK